MTRGRLSTASFRPCVLLKPSTRTFISCTRVWDSVHHSSNCALGVASRTVSPDGSLNGSLHGLEIGKTPPAVAKADNVRRAAAAFLLKAPFLDVALLPPELVGLRLTGLLL